MGVLSDSEILQALHKQIIAIDPLDANDIQPASIDIHLHKTIEVPRFSGRLDIAALRKDDLKSMAEEVDISSGYELGPNQFVTGYSAEHIRLTSQITGRIFNRNSLARWGINAALSSFINPGFKGRKVIVIHNFSPVSIILRPGIRICQLELSYLESNAVRSFEDRHDAAKLPYADIYPKYHPDDKNIDNPFSNFLDEQIKIAARR